MNKFKFFRLVEEEEDDGWGIRCQEVYDKDKVVFDVYGFDGCPEDAIIGRGLFDAGDWLKAVSYGIELAKQGYDGVAFEK